MILHMPFPPKKLMPNRRIHWAEKARLTQMYRSECFWAARSQGIIVQETQPSSLPIRFTFHPPDKRIRDMDNLVTATKALRDGLQDAIGINDRLFICTYDTGPQTKGGLVVVEVEPYEFVWRTKSQPDSQKRDLP